jgi:hypothetical protein
MSTPTANTKAPTAETAGHVNMAVTKVDQFLTELDGGQFAVMVAEALSTTAMSTVDLQREGQITITMKFKPIKGTQQVQIDHGIKLTKPTIEGKTTIEASRETPMHVGPGGALSIVPISQLSFLNRNGQPTNGN